MTTPGSNTQGMTQMDAEAAQFYAATARGKLMVKHCHECDRSHHHPRTTCPFCFSGSVHWREVPGTGTIYTFTVPRQRDKEPYAVAYVTLDVAGISILSHIVDCDVGQLRIGQAVVATFAREGELVVPKFRLAIQ